jgi:L-amino acid N-acyltransferase YncA
MTSERGTEITRLNVTGIAIRPVSDADRKAIMQTFNHYATTGFAAYPEGPVPDRLFDLLRDESISFVVAESEESVIGFGLLKPFMPFAAFHATATASYFVEPGYTGSGVGHRILEYLEVRAKEAGITTLVVHISSKNEASIQFHLRNGFTEAGRLRSVGEKFGEPFDVVWMQKTLS